jgi:hypothetical protein
MKTTTLPVLLVGVLLGAGLAMAKPKPTTQPPPPPVTKEMPKTCEDQCALMEKTCSDPCKKIKKGSAQAKQACSANCDQMAVACSGSCREKGRIDAQYIMEHIKPPKAPGGVPQRKESDE